MSVSRPDTSVSLGLGLVSIGRPWGHRNGQPPSEADALDLLGHALARGIRFFDTAPAYATSEQILGRFLKDLGSGDRNLTIATKMGEHWDFDKQTGFTDHSYDALCRSLDRSLDLLGRIDVLQIHKASVETLSSKDLARAIAYARSAGIVKIGASISDVDTARMTCRSGDYSYVQFPYNRLSVNLEPVFEMAKQADMTVLVNRPLAMGQLAEDGSIAANPISEAFGFILRQPFQGVVLTGTRSKQHLDESISAFEQVS